MILIFKEVDLWVVSGATPLKDVFPSLGTIEAAGCLILKGVPPYSIVGMPIKTLKYRFSSIEIIELKSNFYDLDKR
jgi:acetyltransferase-like isoleucine patch superfamily enzyme